MLNERKIQIVTGGTSGMGLETAKALAEFGPVLIGGRSEKRLEDAMEELKKSGVEAYGKTCDVSDLNSLKEFCDYALTIAPIGNVVNAAGVDFDNIAKELIVKINMVGTINVVETFYPYMENSTLLNYSSITGYFYNPTSEEIAIWNDPNAEDFADKVLEKLGQATQTRSFLSEAYPTYCASKKFVIHYTMANVSRFGAKNNRILSIAPGSFDTPMLANQAAYMESIKQGTAFKRVGTPEEMATLIKKLLGPGNDYLTGCDIVMDGGKLAIGTVKQL